MKKVTYIFITMLLFISSTMVAGSASANEQLRDSIFKVYHSMSDTNSKVNYVHAAFYANIDKDWVVDLLDSILPILIKHEKKEAELGIRVEYYRYYKYLADVPKMEHYLQELRTASLKYKSYTYYFQVWADMLQFYNVKGDTEYVRIQSLKMEEEAKQFKSEMGIMYAHLTMARALTASNKREEAIKMFKKILESPAIKSNTRVMVHSQVVSAYLELKQNKEALRELDVQRGVLDKFVKDNPEQASNFEANRMEMELNYCAAYNNMNDTNNLLKHLLEAKKYYSPHCFFSNYIGYHVYWGAYYRLTQQWDKCFREFDTALAHIEDIQPLYETTIQHMKGKALIEAGRYKEAALLFKNLTSMKDSINHDVIKLHKEALQANYNIRKALLEKETLERQYNWITVGLVLLLGVSVLIMVLYAYKVQQALRRAEQETREALKTVDATNKMKEIFLRNITYQIRGPLNVVVGFAEILAIDKDLTPKQLKEYSVSIKKNAALLSQLIIDVLDLSRLESGMMKFNVTECDVVQLCRDAGMAITMQEHNTIQPLFETTLDSSIIETDSGRFLKMLLSILSSPNNSDKEAVVRYYLSHEETHLKIVVDNSPLFRQPENIQHIKHSINKLFLETFHGTYQLSQNGETNHIVITYPLK